MKQSHVIAILACVGAVIAASSPKPGLPPSSSSS
jgi:hypothetical protein